MKSRIALLALAALPCFAADVTGTWKTEFDSQIGHLKYIYVLKQDGTNLTGKANSEVNDQKREAELKEGKVEGDKISFVEPLNINGNDIRISYTGTISSNEMKLTREVGNFATMEIVAKREPSAAQATAGSGQPGQSGRRGFSGPIELQPEDPPDFPPVSAE